MASRRVTLLASRALYNSCRIAVPATPSAALRNVTTTPLSLGARIEKFSRLSGMQVRWHTAPASKPKVYDFETVKSLSSEPNTDRVLIDVREPAEYEAGYIPNAINIPVASAPDALFMPADEFEDKFGFAKPKADQELVFYCKAGVRSSAAAQLAQQVGYQNVSEYRGSWLDWQKNGGNIEK